VNASNGELVSTPPKSKITASIVKIPPSSIPFQER